MSKKRTRRKKLFGEALRVIRKAQNLTQEEVANFIGVSSGSMVNWETRGRMPKDDHFEKILELYRVNEAFVHFLAATPEDWRAENDLENYYENSQRFIIETLRRFGHDLEVISKIVEFHNGEQTVSSRPGRPGGSGDTSGDAEPAGLT